MPENICAPFGAWGMVLEEAISTRVTQTQLRRVYRVASIGPESEVTYSDFQPSRYLMSVQRTSRNIATNATRVSNDNSTFRQICNPIHTKNKNKHERGKREAHWITPHHIA